MGAVVESAGFDGFGFRLRARVSGPFPVVVRGRLVPAERRPPRRDARAVAARLPRDVHLAHAERLGVDVWREVGRRVGDDAGSLVPQRLAEEVLAQHERRSVLAHRDVAAAVGGVPVVLDGVFRPPGDLGGDVGPAVAELLVRGDESAFLLLRPRPSFDVGLEVVVPALPALLARAHVEKARDLGPLLGAVLLDEPAGVEVRGRGGERAR